MAFKVITNNASVFPFLSKKMGFNQGLDPMGLQNTSDATFSILLPGLNNVTNRIRYYSFYCWLLNEYSKINGSTDPEQQKTFIRRAEYIIALSSHFIVAGNMGISGSNFAGSQLKKEGFEHNLISGSYENGSTDDTYWNYSWGIFGQYYKGSMRKLNLITEIEQGNEVYMRTNKREMAFVSGENLAMAFDENVTTEAKSIFLTAIEKGKINDDELKKLLPSFDLTKVPVATTEQELLLEMLLQQDFPLQESEEQLTNRKITVKYLLEFIDKNADNFSEREFVYSIYNDKGFDNEEKKVTLKGWYYYQFNEFWQYANTALLNGFLGFIQEENENAWHPLEIRLQFVTKQVCESIFDQLKLSNTNTLEDVLNCLVADEKDLYEATKGTNGIERVTNAFLLIFSTYLNNKEYLQELDEFGEHYHVAKDGVPSTYFMGEFEAKLNLDFEKYVYSYLMKKVLLRHQYVALKKMRGSEVSSQKFIIEENRLRYLSNFEPGYTGPRINNLRTFLMDLDLVDDKYNLTDKGMEILQTLQNETA